MGVGLLTEAVSLIGNLIKKTPKKDKAVRNAGLVAVGAGAASAFLPPEFTDVVPEPWITIIRGGLMIIGGVFALLAQSQVQKNNNPNNEEK